MSIITISGNLYQVSDQLRRLNEVVKNREAMGFQLLQHDEEWMYIGARDEKECDGLCRPLEHTIIRGDDIPRRFPLYAMLDGKHVAANRHPYCRCVLELENVGEVMEARLHTEKLAVVTVG